MAHCSPRGCKEPDITELLNNNSMFVMGIVSASHRSTQIYYHFCEWSASVIPLLETAFSTNGATFPASAKNQNIWKYTAGLQGGL